MPTINESEMSNTYSTGLCIVCYELLGDTYLCGEGYICSQCLAENGDTAVEEVMLNPASKEVKDKARVNIANERLRDEGKI